MPDEERRFLNLFYDLKNPSAYAGSQVFVGETRKKEIPGKHALS